MSATRSPARTPGTPRPAGRAARSRAALPLLAGSLIAAAGLVFGGLTTAGADRGHPTPPVSTRPATHGDSIPNVTLVENQIKAYYGSVPGGSAVVNNGYVDQSVSLTYPDPNGNYAAEVTGIEAKAKRYLSSHAGTPRSARGSAKPALVFDVDDTTLNTYDYELYSSFAYNPTTNAEFVNKALFPEVYGMPALVNWAASKGYAVFFLTGRPNTQRDGTVTNLQKVGYTVPTDVDHLYLKPTATDPIPSYLPCQDSIKSCTTTQYKSATRAHIESLGYRIVADFGDQYSDLNGGYSGRTVKIPNPMYYLP